MIRELIGLLFLIVLSQQLTIELNNIHYGYRNIYVGQKYSIQRQILWLQDYAMTKSELTNDVLGFVDKRQNKVGIDMSKLVKQYDINEIDTQSPNLMFKFIQKPFIVIDIYTQNGQQAQINFLNQISGLGQNISPQDL